MPGSTRTLVPLKRTCITRPGPAEQNAQDPPQAREDFVVVRCSLFGVCCSVFVILSGRVTFVRSRVGLFRRSASVVRRSLFGVRCTLLVVRCARCSVCSFASVFSALDVTLDHASSTFAAYRCISVIQIVMISQECGKLLSGKYDLISLLLSMQSCELEMHLLVAVQ